MQNKIILKKYILQTTVQKFHLPDHYESHMLRNMIFISTSNVWFQLSENLFEY